MLKKILLGLAVVVVILVTVIATRPAEFRIVRSATVAAPPAAIRAQIADFHRWDAWSPWAKLDPAMKTTHTGTPGAVGSTYAWVGNDQVGEGRMTLTGADPSTITIKLEFIKPFAATNVSTFELAPRAGGTEVTWSMAGRNNFMSKAFSMVMDMDKLVGADFEKGLGQLKTVAEATPAPAAPMAIPAVAR